MSMPRDEIHTNEYAPEIKTYEPNSVWELEEMLIKTGIWGQETVDFRGEKISWNQQRLDKIYADFLNGERTFSILTSYENGEPKQKLRTELYVVSAIVTCEIDGKLYKMRQGQQTTVAKRSQPEIEDESPISWYNIPPENFRSVSGKRKKEEDPDSAIIRELKEELGVEIEIDTIQQTAQKTEEMYSPGYPGLLTNYSIIGYEVRITPDSFRELYRELKHKDVEGSKLTREYNVFGWEEV